MNRTIDHNKGGWLDASVSTEPRAMNAAACIRQSCALTPRNTAPRTGDFNSDGTVRKIAWQEENRTTSGKYAGDAENYTGH